MPHQFRGTSVLPHLVAHEVFANKHAPAVTARRAHPVLAVLVVSFVHPGGHAAIAAAIVAWLAYRRRVAYVSHASPPLMLLRLDTDATPDHRPPFGSCRRMSVDKGPADIRCHRAETPEVAMARWFPPLPKGTECHIGPRRVATCSLAE